MEPFFKREGLSLPILTAVSRFYNFPPVLPNSENLLNFCSSINVFNSSKLACSKVTRRTVDSKHLAFFFSTFSLPTYSIQRWIQNPFKYLKMALEWLKALNDFRKKFRSSCLTGNWICLCNIMILHSSNDHSIKPPLQPRRLAINYMNFVFRGLFSWLMQDKMMWCGTNRKHKKVLFQVWKSLGCQTNSQLCFRNIYSVMPLLGRYGMMT